MRSRNRHFRGSIIANLILVLGLGAFLTSGLLASMGRFWRQPSSSRAQPRVAVTSASVTAAAVLAGLDTENLLAAGVTCGQFAGLAAAVAAQVRDHPDTLADRANGPQAIFAAVTTSFSDAQRAALQAIRANSQWKVPPAYRLVERTPTEWIRLRDALADEAIAASKRHTLDRGVSTYLAGVRANSAVAAALRNANNAAAARTAWGEAANAAARAR